MAWEPIDTAPKDGTWILLRGGNSSESFYMRDTPAEDRGSRPRPARGTPAAWCAPNPGMAPVHPSDPDTQRHTESAVACRSGPSAR